MNTLQNSRLRGKQQKGGELGMNPSRKKVQMNSPAPAPTALQFTGTDVILRAQRKAGESLVVVVGGGCGVGDSGDK